MLKRLDQSLPIIICLSFLSIYSCNRSEEQIDISLPSPLSIDIDHDDTADFMSGSRTSVADGVNYVAYGYSLIVESLDTDRHSLLQNTESLGLFLRPGDTIQANPQEGHYWVRNIYYAHKEVESTNNFKDPGEWTIQSNNDESAGIIAYRTQDTLGTYQLGWMYVIIDHHSGELNIVQITDPISTDQLLIQ